VTEIDGIQNLLLEAEKMDEAGGFAKRSL